MTNKGIRETPYRAVALHEIAKHTLDFMHVFILHISMTFRLTCLKHNTLYIEIDFF